jgi:hypothetical protein
MVRIFGFGTSHKQSLVRQEFHNAVLKNDQYNIAKILDNKKKMSLINKRSFTKTFVKSYEVDDDVVKMLFDFGVPNDKFKIKKLDSDHLIAWSIDNNMMNGFNAIKQFVNLKNNCAIEAMQTIISKENPIAFIPILSFILSHFPLNKEIAGIGIKIVINDAFENDNSLYISDEVIEKFGVTEIQLITDIFKSKNANQFSLLERLHHILPTKEIINSRLSKKIKYNKFSQDVFNCLTISDKVDIIRDHAENKTITKLTKIGKFVSDNIDLCCQSLPFEVFKFVVFRYIKTLRCKIFNKMYNSAIQETNNYLISIFFEKDRSEHEPKYFTIKAKIIAKFVNNSYFKGLFLSMYGLFDNNKLLMPMNSIENWKIMIEMDYSGANIMMHNLIQSKMSVANIKKLSHIFKDPNLSLPILQNDTVIDSFKEFMNDSRVNPDKIDHDNFLLALNINVKQFNKLDSRAKFNIIKYLKNFVGDGTNNKYLLAYCCYFPEIYKPTLSIYDNLFMNNSPSTLILTQVMFRKYSMNAFEKYFNMELYNIRNINILNRLIEKYCMINKIAITREKLVTVFNAISAKNQKLSYPGISNKHETILLKKIYPNSTIVRIYVSYLFPSTFVPRFEDFMFLLNQSLITKAKMFANHFTNIGDVELKRILSIKGFVNSGDLKQIFDIVSDIKFTELTKFKTKTEKKNISSTGVRNAFLNKNKIITSSANDHRIEAFIKCYDRLVVVNKQYTNSNGQVYNFTKPQTGYKYIYGGMVTLSTSSSEYATVMRIYTKNNNNGSVQCNFGGIKTISKIDAEFLGSNGSLVDHNHNNLFHCTGYSGATSVVQNGFDLGMARKGNYGSGIYTSLNATKSLCYGDTLLICRALYNRPKTTSIGPGCAGTPSVNNIGSAYDMLYYNGIYSELVFPYQHQVIPRYLIQFENTVTTN